MTELYENEAIDEGRVFEATADPMVVMKSDGAIIRANRAFTELTGRVDGSLPNTGFVDLVHPSDQPAALRVLDRMNSGEPNCLLDCRVLDANGAHRLLSWNIAFEPDDNVVFATGREVAPGTSWHPAGGDQDESFFDAMLSSVDAFVFAWNRQEQFVYANEALMDLWQVQSPADYYGKTAAELDYPPELHQAFSEEIAYVFETGDSTTREIPYVSPRGEFGYYTYRLTPMLDAESNVALISGVAWNTTQRRIAEESLRASEERLRLAMVAADMYSFEIDLETHAFTWSEDAEQMYGVPTPATLDEVFAVAHPDDRESVSAALNEAISQGGEFEIEFRVIDPKSGGELWLFSAGVAIADGGEIPTKVVGIAQNITGRKRSDRILYESQERKAFLLDLSDRFRRQTEPRAIIDIASELLGRYLRVSQVGYAEVESDEETFVAGGEYSDGRMPGIVGYRARLSDHGPEFADELRVGRAVFVENNRIESALVPGGTAASRRIGVVASAAIPLVKGNRLRSVLYALHPQERSWPEHDRELLREVAERTWEAVERARAEKDREQARAEAEHAVRARDMFLSIASHELRNPMASVKASAQLLMRFLERTEAVEAFDERERRLASTLIRSSNRLAVLVDDMLDVSRLQSGQLRVDLQPGDFAALVRDTVNEFQPTIPGYSIDLDVSDGRPTNLDQDRIRQIIVNLLDNAAKYSPEGSEIAVRLRHDDEGSLLTVVDHGIGLPAGEMDEIFEPFGRAENASRSNIPGMGLGLYICRRLAEAHGGRLWAESDGEGRGTRLCLWLPSCEGEPA
jgi:PAS domain S-box-containing protein